LEGHANDVLGVAFRPDGQVVAGSGQDGSIRLWDTGTGKHLRTLHGHTGPVRRLAFSPDGNRVASASYDQTVRLWDADSGKVLKILEGHKSSLWCVAFSPDGASIVSGSENGKLILWDTTSGKLLRQWQLPGAAATVAFASDGRHLVTANRNGTSYVLRLGPAAFVPQDNASPTSPSPFDALRSDQIPAYEKKVAGGGDPDSTPAELVAILGDSRLKHTEKVQDVEFASAGKWIVSAGWDRIIRFWHSGNGEELSASSPLIERVFSLSLNKDETLLAAAHENGSITIADVDGPHITSQLIFKAHDGRVSALAWSPDGQTLASANWGKDKTVKLWDVATGKKLAQLVHANNIHGLAFSLDGKTLFSASLSVQSWDLTDLTTPKELKAFKGIDGAWTTRLALSADGKHLAASFSNGAVKIWQLSSGQEKNEIRLSKPATALAFDKTAAKLFVGTAEGSLKSVELAEGQEIFSVLAHVGPVLDVACSPDGARLVTAGDEGAVKVWDADTGKELLPIRGHAGVLTRLANSQDGTRIVASGADRTLRIWDVNMRHDLLTCRGHLQRSGSVAFDASGTRLVSSSPDGTVRVWDAKSGHQSFVCYDSKQVAWWVAFSPDGTRLAVGLNTGVAKVWDAHTGRELLVLEGHQKPVIHVGFSPDGQRLATASNDSTVKVWEIGTGRELLSIVAKHNPVETAFLADGLRMAIGWSDGNIRSYDARTGSEDLLFKGLGGGTRALSASADGKYLAATTAAGRILVWEAATAKKIHDWHFPVVISHIAFTPDGRHLVTANLNGTLFVLRLKGS
jgi:WD40 repeat protein